MEADRARPSGAYTGDSRDQRPHGSLQVCAKTPASPGAGDTRDHPD